MTQNKSEIIKNENLISKSNNKIIHSKGELIFIHTYRLAKYEYF